mmetsp:Transcript_33413/g.38913  ORF Transcript_33413/g.38913 Transcript_33413/m.38913 type:complete len:256 (+) Transcript_33413:46-813(+)
MFRRRLAPPQHERFALSATAMMIRRLSTTDTASPSEKTSSVTTAVPIPPLKSSDEIAAEESLNQQRQVDPFRIGYNMGMQTVHLESLRSKLDDNLELLKSHFHSLRETLRTNHESLRTLQHEHNKQSRAQMEDAVEHLKERMDGFAVRLQANEDTLRELTKQQFGSLKSHVDDRLENIKDTIKLFVGLLLALNVWVLFLVNQIAHQHHPAAKSAAAAASQSVPAHQQPMHVEHSTGGHATAENTQNAKQSGGFWK